VKNSILQKFLYKKRSKIFKTHNKKSAVKFIVFASIEDVLAGTQIYYNDIISNTLTTAYLEKEKMWINLKSIITYDDKNDKWMSVINSFYEGGVAIN